jgi:hypothetical protein
VWRLHKDPKSLDPARAGLPRERTIMRQTHEGLLRPDPVSGQPTPALAESWSVDPDQRRYLFRLRRGVRFHDGRPLRAADVVYSLSRHFAPEVASTIYPYLRVIAGGKERKEGKASSVSGLRAVDGAVPDARTSLSRPTLSIWDAGGRSSEERSSRARGASGHRPLQLQAWESEAARALGVRRHREAPRCRVIFRSSRSRDRWDRPAGRSMSDNVRAAPRIGRQATRSPHVPALGLVALGVDRSASGTSVLLRRAVGRDRRRIHLPRHERGRTGRRVRSAAGATGHDPTLAVRRSRDGGPAAAEAGHPADAASDLRVATPSGDNVTADVP